ncbi:hypothetical protein [Dysgonomonas sp. 25]|uniref:hypothetical protein n=1 Tax=Dysgonomonas sp. 25 TaxID=2302933 RepID=UPI0013D6EB29|nr:hypothetical protein [Dysgonomonas sp. 25]NDV68594.1 hypothetical protein [Dysgonomonas sp. 25]
MQEPSIQDEKDLLSIQNNEKEDIVIPRTNKILKVGWMKGYTLEKLSKLELKEGLKENDADSEKVIEQRSKFMAKAASLCLLNGIKIFFFHWFYWRYFYYLRGYTFDQLEPILVLAKKKVPAASWYIGLALVARMKITNMTMTMEEAERFRHVLSSEAEQQ